MAQKYHHSLEKGIRNLRMNCEWPVMTSFCVETLLLHCFGNDSWFVISCKKNFSRETFRGKFQKKVEAQELASQNPIILFLDCPWVVNSFKSYCDASNRLLDAPLSEKRKVLILLFDYFRHSVSNKNSKANFYSSPILCWTLKILMTSIKIYWQHQHSKKTNERMSILLDPIRFCHTLLLFLMS